MSTKNVLITIAILAVAVFITFLYSCFVVSARESRMEEKEEMRRRGK